MSHVSSSFIRMPLTMTGRMSRKNMDTNQENGSPVSHEARMNMDRRRSKRQRKRMQKASSHCFQFQLFLFEMMALGIFLSSTTTTINVVVVASTASGSFPARLPPFSPDQQSREDAGYQRNAFWNDAGGSSDDGDTDELESSSDFEMEEHEQEKVDQQVLTPLPIRPDPGSDPDVVVASAETNTLPTTSESTTKEASTSMNDTNSTSNSSSEVHTQAHAQQDSFTKDDDSQNGQTQTQDQTPQEPDSTPEESPVPLAPLALDPPSQPLQTLQKLQQMLDETDYMTASRHTTHTRSASAGTDTNSDHRSSSSSPPPTPDTTTRADTYTTTSTRRKTQATAATNTATSTNVERTQTQTQTPDTPEKLWTSKDRSKYKKQQLRYRRVQVIQEHRDRMKAAAAAASAAASPPIHQYSSDDEVSDTDDGLGYSLPNLPVYYSDAEAESDTDGGEFTTTTAQFQQQQQRPIMQPASPLPNSSAPPVANTNAYPPPPLYYPQYGQPPDQQYMQQQPQPQQPQQQQQQYPQYGYPPNAYPYQYPQYGPLPPSQPQHNYHQQQQQQQQRQQQHYQQQYAQQYAAWAAASGYLPQPYTTTTSPPYPRTQPQHQQQPASAIRRIPDASVPVRPKHVKSAVRVEPEGSPTLTTRDALSNPNLVSAFPMIPMIPPPSMNEGELSLYAIEKPSALVEAKSSQISFVSVQKASLMLVFVALASYSAVSPRTLALTDYNLQFYENLRIVSLAAIVPAVNMLTVFDSRHNDVNAVLNSFFVAFSFGYVWTLVMEIVVTTLVRLAVFCWFEPDIFRLTPSVPVPVLPWVLRDNLYRPKRITLFAADFGTTCVACPIIEEYVKLKLLQWTTKLPRNFNWVEKVNSKKKTKRRTAAAIAHGPGEQDIVNANKYVTHMLAVSLGLKLLDATRRILVYTKAHHPDKSFYAACRGLFPIQELCGTMTALELAKRDLLGVDMPLWKLLAPAVVIHAMANFRGMKPIFKWNSATPWSEMQLLPLHEADSLTLAQFLSKGFGRAIWAIIIGKTLGRCVKNYYMVNRQAVKRTTIYAGNHAAFSAELATEEMLKKK